LPVVAIDYTPAYEQGGGIGRYVRELVGALAACDTATDYRLFVAGGHSRAILPSLGSNFQWKRTRLSPKWLARLWFRAGLSVPVEVFVGPIDLYHATDFVLPSTLARTRTILTVHDLSFVRVPDAASPRLKAYLDRVVPDSVRRADHVLADSQATKEDLVALYGVLPEKITVLLSGVGLQFQCASSGVVMTTRIRYGLGSHPYILAVGTVQPRKNYGRLIQALALLRAQGYDLDLVIAGGRGWLEDPIYETVHTLQMTKHVRFIGFAREEDLPALYSGAICLAFPSLYEGFGLPVLEAMACGTPVVTSNVSSLPEVAGDAALMVDPYNVEAIAYAIKRILDDGELRGKLIERGYAQTGRFSWDKSARQLLQIYSDML